MRKYLLPIIGAIALALVMSMPVMAAPGNITSVHISSTSTSATLRWTLASASTSTMVRYGTVGYPATTADGTNANAGTSYFVTVSSLTPGTTYYFSMWGYDGANYSASAYNIAISTTLVNVATGGARSNAVIPPLPDLPNDMLSAPNSGGLDLREFTNLFTAFNNSPGGFAMDLDNVWEFVVYCIITAGAVFAYRSSKSMFIGWCVSLLGTIAGYYMHLTQLYGIIVIIVIGIGAWAFNGLTERG